MSKSRLLTKEKYLSKFSRAVRWRLPPQEAEDAISDYRELIFHAERDETKLVEELGEPVQAAHLLTDVKTYRRWLWVFGILAFGLFLMAKWSWTGQTFARFYPLDLGPFDRGWRCVTVLAAGLVLSLVWFRRNGQKHGPVSKWLLIFLAVVLVFGVGIMILTYRIFLQAFLNHYAEIDVTPWEIILQRELIIDGGTVCAVIALAGLLLARLKDRRWLALYTLALTAAVLCVMVQFWVTSIDPSWAMQNNPTWYMFSKLIPVGVVGLIGTGVALC